MSRAPRGAGVRRRRWLGAGGAAEVGAVVALLGAGCVDDGGPRLDAATPSAAGHGALVVLSGRRLCGPRGDCASAGGAIQIGFDPPVVLAPVVSYEDTAAQIVIPTAAPAGPTSLIATVNELASNALAFEVLP